MAIFIGGDMDRKWLRNSFIGFLIEDFALRKISPQTFRLGLAKTVAGFVYSLGLDNAQVFRDELIKQIKMVKDEREEKDIGGEMDEKKVLAPKEIMDWLKMLERNITRDKASARFLADSITDEEMQDKLLFFVGSGLDTALEGIQLLIYRQLPKQPITLEEDLGRS